MLQWPIVCSFFVFSWFFFNFISTCCFIFLLSRMLEVFQFGQFLLAIFGANRQYASGYKHQASKQAVAPRPDTWSVCSRRRALGLYAAGGWR